jgi:hypothetical protein
MKRWITGITMMAMALSVSAADKKGKTKAAPKPATPAAQQVVIPKDATPNANGTFSYTDKAGNKWIYRKTPFGIAKIADMSGFAPVIAAAPAGQFLKTTDNGETVKFERQSPFGTTKWEKKKSELTDEERSMVELQSAKAEQKP